jgi:sporulation protein YabP
MAEAAATNKPTTSRTTKVSAVTDSKKHSINLIDGEKIEIAGVSHVESFDKNGFCLKIEGRLLYIKGKELSLDQADIDKGAFIVKGHVEKLYYKDQEKPKEKRQWCQSLIA